MANLHLVTGYAGAAHVTAADDGSFNRAIFGDGQYVFDFGSKFAASVVSNNKITIADGDLLMQGRHVRLNEGTTVDLTITNGTQGKLRNDLIVARYTKDAVSGVEQVDLVVIQGTAVDSDPADPEYTSGDIINDHDLVNDMPLYRVPLDGLNVGTPVALFELASVQISDGAVTAAKIGDGAVTTGKLAGGFVLPLANGGTGATSAASARNALGLGNTTGALPIANGGTGATSAASARNALGLGNTTGALPIANGGTGATSAASALSNLGGISIKKLWENASPTSSFESQTLSLDIAPYDFLLIFHYGRIGPNNANTDGYQASIVPIGITGNLSHSAIIGETAEFVYEANRVVMTNKTEKRIWIGRGRSVYTFYNSSTSDRNDNNLLAAIPYQIYGIKEVT